MDFNYKKIDAIWENDLYIFVLPKITVYMVKKFLSCKKFFSQVF